jgi:hypothetical protein
MPELICSALVFHRKRRYTRDASARIFFDIEACMNNTGRIVAFVIAAILLLAFMVVCVAAAVLVILALMGPAIGNVYDNIIQNMGIP